MENTIARISILLPIQIFGAEFNDIAIIYKSVICYNKDNDVVAVAKKDDNFARSEMYKAFKEPKKRIKLSDVFGRNHEVEMFFFKNPDAKKDSFSINFEELFFEDWEAQAALHSDMTCPILKKIPAS